MFARQVQIALKGTAQVAAPGLQIQAGLGRRVPDASAALRKPGDVENGGESPDDFPRLVEAPFSQSRVVQGHGQDEVGRGMVGPCLGKLQGQAIGEPVRHGQGAAVFAMLHQGVQGKSVGIYRDGLFEGRRMLQTMAAESAVVGRQGALGATFPGQTRHIFLAAGAEHAAHHPCAAK